MKKWVSFFLACTIIFTPRLCMAQAGKDGAPVTVQTIPGVSTISQTVTVNGTVVVNNKAQSVSIKIIKPNGQQENLSANTDANGSFTKSYSNTQLQGWYAVTVTAADGKGKGTDSFYVTTAEGVATSYKERMSALQTLATKNIDAVLNRLNQMPSDPQMEQNKGKLKDAKKKLGELKNKTDGMGNAFGKLIKEVNTVPDAIQSMQTHYKELDNWQQEADAKIPVLEKQLSDFQDVSTTCENLNNLAEICGLASWIMNFQGKFTKIMINIASDKVLPAAVDKMKITGNETVKETKKLAINEAQKGMTSAALGFDEIKDFMTKGILVDVIQYVMKVLYAQKCIDLKGPINARLDAYIYNGADKYWTYAIELTGTLVLRYEKNADLTKPSEITGEFEGYRTKYEFWEDIEKVEPFPKGSMVKRFRRTPIPVNASSISSDLGLAGRAAVPGSYLVKVKGKLINNTLTLEVLRTIFDNLETQEKNRLSLIMVNPILPIPVIRTFDFPIAKSRVVFVVGLGEAQAIPLQKTGSKIVVKHKMTNSRQPDSEIKLTSTINMSLSN